MAGTRNRSETVTVRTSKQIKELMGAIASHYEKKFMLGNVSQADVFERAILREAKALGLLEDASEGKDRKLAVGLA